MGKSSKKKLEASLTEADASLRDLESTRAALSEELRSERERHAEETVTLRRQHEQLVEEAKRSAQEELNRVGEELTEARSALRAASEEKARLAADLRDRDEHSGELLQDVKALGDVLEAALGQLSDVLKRLRDVRPADTSVSTPEGEGVAEVDPISTPADAQESDGHEIGNTTREAEGGSAAKLTATEPSSSSAAIHEPDAPSGDAEPAAPPGEGDGAASYEDDWYRFLKKTPAPGGEHVSPPA